MGSIARAMFAPRQAPMNKAFDEWFWPEFLQGYTSKAGQTVTTEAALKVMAVLGCTRVLSEDVAQVTRDLYRKTKDGAEIAEDHRLRDLLVYGPNEFQTGFEFFEQLVIHAAMSGRSLSFKNVVRGEIRELLPFEPGFIRVEKDEFYRTRYYAKSPVTGEEQEFPAAAIWHVKGPSWNGWDGLEIMKLAREAIGLSIATEEAHALMHANGGQTAGIVSVEEELDDEQYKKLRRWIDKHIIGQNRFKPFVLDRGAKWLQTSMTGVDAQHLETRKFQIEEVCRAFRVFPLMIGYSDKTSTFASVQELIQAHVKFSLGGWFRRIEESVNKNLLTQDERRGGLYFKFRPVSLLSGDEKQRGDFYQRLYNMGAINSNEIRAREEMNAYEGGNTFRVPANTVDATADPDDTPEPTQQPKPAQNTRSNVGRVLSARNERRIRDASGLLDEVLDELGDNED